MKSNVNHYVERTMTDKTEERIFKFGPFLLDSRNELLLYENKPMRLGKKEFRALLALVEATGFVISSRELKLKIWQDGGVSEQALHATIGSLRKTLGPNARQYIAAVPQRGYRLTISVTKLFLSERQSSSPTHPMQEPLGIHSLRIFLCYCSADKQAVRDLYHRLKEDGFCPWLDEEDLLPGQDWRRETPIAVRSSHVVLVCLSRKFNKAGYRQKEVRLALDVAEEQPEGAIFLVPLKLEECEVLDGLKQWHWANLFQSDGYGKLLRSLRSRSSTL